ncbi:receptor-interacting serine/threonine-protein kinase 3-like isoform X3 [Mugil cephalus]|uniref:receptor-interacting serine/threonine-protein kinase 3-like isoform X3 n=1 Tax=Mugil cephalus TaxID=48193 RepID=UPI001FB62F72|nr:receptor-interacting serine/threonine-protein kinase 3-like isoform X3 [Mugil cephalus]
MALLSNKSVRHESLENLEHIGSGGFGVVYKARHKDWDFDVAIKVIREAASSQLSHSSPIVNDEKALHDEADHMDTASCPFVLRILGIYQGNPPKMSKGIVMEFMGRGSILSLRNELSGPPPWPLAFRLAHEVALGMNFLHSKNLLHQDLKPSNVLLDDDLHAKLADFGLARVSTSALKNEETTGVLGGSYKYMPPEAFPLTYKPVRAFDRYSYGILLWSILTGKEPYPDAEYARVHLRIPLGDRPDCKEIDLQKAEGLKELVDLMKRCWDAEPSNRPEFKECLEVTESVLSMHKKGIADAVHRVLTGLGSPTTAHNSNKSPSFSVTPQTQDSSLSFAEQPKSYDSVDGFMIQKLDSDSAENLTDSDKAKFIDTNRAKLTQGVSEVLAIVEELGDMVHGETYSTISAEPTSQGKMRVLYQRTFRSGGIRVKAAFYDVLKKHHPDLV